MTQKFGLLAGRAGYPLLPLQVLQSAAGFYLGTCSNEEGPVSRESVEYFRTQAEADRALSSGGWTQRSNP